MAIKVSCCEFTVSPPSRKAVGCVRSRDGVEMTEEDPVRVRRIKLGSGLPALLFGIPVQMQRPCLWFLIWHAATVESRTARVLCRVANYLLKWVTRRGRLPGAPTIRKSRIPSVRARLAGRIHIPLA